MKIANKIRIAVIAVITVQLLNSVILSVRSGGVQKATDEIWAPLNTRSRQASEWLGLAQANAARVTAVALSSDANVQSALKNDIATAESRVAELEGLVKSGALPGPERAQFEKVAAARQAMAAA